MVEVLCVGILVADVLARPVDATPQPGELSLCEEIRVAVGGCAANTSIGLQRLGVSAAVCGKVGRDEFGLVVRRALTAEGVDVRGIGEDAHAPTSATVVLVAGDSERAFIHSVGANSTLRPAEVDFAGARLLHVAGWGLMPGFEGEECARLLQRARAAGLQTSLDTAGRPVTEWAAALAPCLPHLDFLLPSFAEARACVPPDYADEPSRVAEYFLQAGVGAVALKLGAAGSYVGARGFATQVPSYAAPAVDSTGAGDAFAAGFLAGVLRGLDLEECARLGNAAGACCVTRIGAVAGLRDWDETRRVTERGGVECE